MDKSEKKRLREKIGERLDVSHTRMSDDDAVLLDSFLDSYESDYRGESRTKASSGIGFDSDDRYRYKESTTYTFTDEPGVRVDYSYEDDDGDSRSSSQTLTDARSVLDVLKKFF